MPIIQIDYSKTIIYKIEHVENENLVYVGHTTNWDKRKYSNKSCCKNKTEKRFNCKLYQMIRENGGWDMFRMIEVEKYPCNDKREAEKKENEVMKILKSNMNTNSSYLSEEEQKEKKMNYDKVYSKKFRESNEKAVKGYQKSYYEKKQQLILDRMKVKVLCECGCEVSKCHLKRHQTSKKHIDLIKNKI